MHNYDLEIDDVSGWRRLVPATTLVLDPAAGVIVASTIPPEVRFKDGAGLVKPVCPFFEVWARYEDNGEFLPLTLQKLEDLGLSAQSVKWDIDVGNLKMLRRTGDAGDRIEANTSGITDHRRYALEGRAANFKSDRKIPLGWIQYVNPSDEFPEIRLRFTPSSGQVYGKAIDINISEQNAVYDTTRGNWDAHTDTSSLNNAVDPRARRPTTPPGIYAIEPGSGQDRISRGYFDDSCDGILSVSLTLVDGRELSSFARVTSGPPDFAPDSLPVRSMADELEQLVLGPAVATVDADAVLDIVRRALETIRLMDTTNLNRRYSDNAFGSAEADWKVVTSIHNSILSTLTKGLRAEASLEERRTSHEVLGRINTILRDYTQVVDLTTAGRRRMPAMMRGADSEDLALNRRQRNKIRKAMETFDPGPLADNDSEATLKRMIGLLQWAAPLHAQFSESGRSLADRFARPEDILDYLRVALAKGDVAVAAKVKGKPLVVPGDPAKSAFLKLIKRADHPMNGPLSNYRDMGSGKDGISIISDWITSLPLEP